jgi:hypothetical protein
MDGGVVAEEPSALTLEMESGNGAVLGLLRAEFVVDDSVDAADTVPLELNSDVEDSDANGKVAVAVPVNGVGDIVKFENGVANELVASEPGPPVPRPGKLLGVEGDVPLLNGYGMEEG